MTRKGLTAFFLFMAMVLGVRCRKTTLFAPKGFVAEGILIGPDARTGLCEGGLFLKINGYPNPNDPINGYYDIGTLPSGFRLDPGLKYPIHTWIDWHISPKCFGNYVDITRIQIIDPR